MFDPVIVHNQLIQVAHPCQDCGAQVELVSFAVFPQQEGDTLPTSRHLVSVWRCKSQYRKTQYDGREDEIDFTRSKECLAKSFMNGVRPYVVEESPPEEFSNGVRGHVVEDLPQEYIQKARSFAPSLKRIAHLMFWADRGKNVKS